MMTRNEAVEAALKLLQKMKSSGWKSRVHENMGWHYSLERGPLKLYEEFHWGKPSYSCLLGVGIGGHGFWLLNDICRDPNIAVKKQLQIARSFVLSCQKTINEAARGEV